MPNWYKNIFILLPSSRSIKTFYVHTGKLMQMMPKHIFRPLSTVLACMLPELYGVKVLFYAESVGLVTSGHVTKMAITPFDSRWPKNLLICKSRIHGSIFSRTKVIADRSFTLREFRVFVQNLWKINFCPQPENDVDDGKIRLLSHKTRISVKRCDLCRFARG